MAVDIADFGRRYMVSDRPSAWLLGFGSHLINSVLLVLIYATMIQPNLPWPSWLAGITWGEVIAITLAGSLIVPLSGLKFMGIKTGNFQFAHTGLWLHGLWSLTAGLLYGAPK